MSSDKTSLGDRMKAYEQPSTARYAFKGSPLVCRLDGNNFHSFARTCEKPYDLKLSTIMQRTLQALVDRFQVTVGYTQSDEITLIWYVPVGSTSELPFGGRLQKIETQVVSFCTTFFMREVARVFPEKVDELPTFDARAFSVPTLMEAVNNLLWRQNDCTKNAVSMAAHSMFSHKSLQNLNRSQLQDKMMLEKGVNFNDYPPVFKRGIFAQRVYREVELAPEVLAKIPEKHRPTGPVRRSSVELLDIWISQQEDPVKALFQVN